jgi:Epoxide hydrolase N terminus
MRVQSSAATRSSAGSDGAAWGGCRRLPRLRRRRGSVAGPRDEGGGGTDDRNRHGPRIKSTRSPATAMGDQGANQGLHGCDVQTRRSGFVAPPNPETDMSVTTEKSAGATAISPFHIEVPQEEIDELRRRAQATRWPDRETVSDRSQGGRRQAVQRLRHPIRPGRGYRVPGRDLPRAAELGPSAPSTTSSTGTRSTRSATSPPGRSRSCSPRKSAAVLPGSPGCVQATALISATKNNGGSHE